MAAIIAAAGVLWFGVPVGTLLVVGVALACPLMMLVMMRGMHSEGASDGERPAGRTETPAG